LLNKGIKISRSGNVHVVSFSFKTTSSKKTEARESQFDTIFHSFFVECYVYGAKLQHFADKYKRKEKIILDKYSVVMLEIICNFVIAIAVT
jgi:hypothetical protein